MTEKEKAEITKLEAEARKLNAEADEIKGKELRRWLIWFSIIAAGQTAAPSIFKELIKMI
ncbi:hypothetical protein NX722_05680 [Endozoicomonas gorgoniicola]|uniref:Uncharacterized protein n=1 Tax=Endozoicomonas gorgoniicola TaxID=1234144 RepID=A0ABT3MRZ6_9GAMM|nr:hypothetical protein [Endozoicomonas gorgoniicola]MCW7552143.1 hypothetical protein [Endozoicomonas gorgoniicola]